jgi:hypothetical protein
MKEIVISDENTITTDIIGQLCQINLLNDVIICCPYWAKANDDILYDIDEFVLFNRNSLKLEPSGHYIFFPRIKIMVPEGVILQTYCKLPGMHVIQSKIEKYKGIQLSTELKLNEFILNLNAIEGTYNIYSRFEYMLKEFNREMFLKNQNGRNISNIKIPEHTDILGLFLIESFVGYKKRDLGEIYLIRSDLLYHTFPNFGGGD